MKNRKTLLEEDERRIIMLQPDGQEDMKTNSQNGTTDKKIENLIKEEKKERLLNPD